LNVQTEEDYLPKTVTLVPTAVVGNRKGRQAGPTSRLNTMSSDTRTTAMSLSCVTELYSGWDWKLSVLSNLAAFVSDPVMLIFFLIYWGRMRLVPLGMLAINWPVASALDHRCIWSILWNMNWQGKP
jgi:hypothetical protein